MGLWDRFCRAMDFPKVLDHVVNHQDGSIRTLYDKWQEDPADDAGDGMSSVLVGKVVSSSFDLRPAERPSADNMEFYEVIVRLGSGLWLECKDDSNNVLNPHWMDMSECESTREAKEMRKHLSISNKGKKETGRRWTNLQWGWGKVTVTAYLVYGKVQYNDGTSLTDDSKDWKFTKVVSVPIRETSPIECKADRTHNKPREWEDESVHMLVFRFSAGRKDN